VYLSIHLPEFISAQLRHEGAVFLVAHSLWTESLHEDYPNPTVTQRQAGESDDDEGGSCFAFLSHRPGDL
jgi:hypothetical protein